MSSKTSFKTYFYKIPSLDHEIFYYSANKISQNEKKGEKTDKY